jgi:hypothetical protein
MLQNTVYHSNSKNHLPDGYRTVSALVNQSQAFEHINCDIKLIRGIPFPMRKSLFFRNTNNVIFLNSESLTHRQHKEELKLLTHKEHFPTLKNRKSPLFNTGIKTGHLVTRPVAILLHFQVFDFVISNLQ